MRAWFGMATSEFVDQLRDVAIKANARPQIIDCIDAIIQAPTEDEIDERIREAVVEAEDYLFDAISDEWRKARKNIVSELDAIGLSEEHMAQVLEAIDGMEPVR